MKLLVDTRAALWWLSGDERFGSEAERELTDDTNQIPLGAAVVWEVAIKHSLGKLQAPEDFAPTLLGAGIQALAVSLEHAASVEHLPWHHRDPFDRMLVAQASIEKAAVVSSDEALRPYGVTLIW